MTTVYHTKALPLLFLTLLVLFLTVAKFCPNFLNVLERSIQSDDSSFSINIVSPLSKNKARGNSLIENEIRKAVQDRNVAHYLGADFKTGSVRLEWPPQNLIVKKPPIALIMVATTAEAKKERMLIRDTWQQWAKDFNMKVVFFMGLPKDGDLTHIFVEASTFEDIVVDDFRESFYALPLKILRMLKWFLNFYTNKNQVSKAQPLFLIKTDHDVFLHIPNIAAYLKNITRTKARPKISNSFMAGALHVDSKVTRNPKSKWFTPTDFWIGETYPPYLGGSFYILNSKLVGGLFRASFKTPLFHLEDVYITGMVANQTLGIELLNLNEGGKVVIEKPRDLREALKFKSNVWNVFAYHGVGHDIMHYFFENVNKRVYDI